MRSILGGFLLLTAGLAGSLALAACGNDTPAPVEEEPTCEDAAEVFTAEKEDSNVLFLYDRSGSMHIRLSDQVTTRWTATKTSFFDMLADLPETTRAGAMFFPLGESPINWCWVNENDNYVTCDPNAVEPAEEPRCNPATYVPGVSNALLNTTQKNRIREYISSADKEFYWGTPLAPALAGAIATQKNASFQGTRSVVLITDGKPTDCDLSPGGNEIQPIVDAASAGFTSEPKVRTFVMGVVDGERGALPQDLSPIAKAGGTARVPDCEASNSCFYQLNASTFQDDIKKAFAQVTMQAFDCTFKAPAAGEDYDTAKTNVTISSSSYGKETIYKDKNHQNGWDFLADGKQIQLYGQACLDVKSDPEAKVEIMIGCATVDSQ